jgi:hypothetical protein
MAFDIYKDKADEKEKGIIMLFEKGLCYRKKLK